MRNLNRHLTTLFLALGLLSAPLYPAYADPSVDSLTDVRAEHWAYKAIKELVEKYGGVMEGFPDKTFRGTNSITRYEAAAAFYKIMLQLSQVSDLTKRIGTITLTDLKNLRTLQEEFQKELESIKKQNGEQAEQIKKLEEQIAKIKDDLGTVRFGGNVSVNAEDVFEDNFRAGYGTNFSLNMRIAATEKTTIRATLSGDFSNTQEENEKGKKGTKSQFATSGGPEVNFGEAWFDHKEAAFLSPRVKFGYMSVTRMIQPFTSISTQFSNSIVGLLDDASTSRADPNLFGKTRGIRLGRTFVAGVELNEGIFNLAVAASPDVIYGQLKLDLGLLKLRWISEGDQSLFIGEPVLDTLHNHTAILDVGNETVGLGLQATFRGLPDDFNFRGASAATNLALGGFNMGASGKFENEKTYQQIIGGLYVSTPSNLKQVNPDFADTNIPSLLIAVQSPFTLLNGELYEGSATEVGDLAGFMVQLSYDNPIIPNLTLEFSQRRKVFINTRDDDIKVQKTTIAISSSFNF